MTKRLNITLPESTVALLDGEAGEGKRSKFIDEALLRYFREIERKKLHKALEEGAIARAENDLEMVREWASLEEEAHETLEKCQNQKEEKYT